MRYAFKNQVNIVSFIIWPCLGGVYSQHITKKNIVYIFQTSTNEANKANYNQRHIIKHRALGQLTVKPLFGLIIMTNRFTFTHGEKNHFPEYVAILRKLLMIDICDFRKYLNKLSDKMIQYTNHNFAKNKKVITKKD